jgi:hypothetical protein
MGTKLCSMVGYTWSEHASELETSHQGMNLRQANRMEKSIMDLQKGLLVSEKPDDSTTEDIKAKIMDIPKGGMAVEVHVVPIDLRTYYFFLCFYCVLVILNYCVSQILL